MSKPDRLTVDITESIDEMVENLLDYYKPEELDQAPDIIRRTVEKAISRLEKQLKDWEAEGV